MIAFIVANLSIVAFNVITTLVIFGLMIAGVPPPDLSVGWFCLIIGSIDIAIWVSIFAVVSSA